MEYLSLPDATAIDMDDSADELILEGIVTTTDEDGDTNVSPMGPIVDRNITRLRLRPFQTSRTYANLKRTGTGIFHVTDDVDLLARAAIGRLVETPPLLSCPVNEEKILASACRWYAFQVETLDDSQQRTEINCRVVQSGRLRDFFGWNRAQFAVVEAAILATRIHLLPLGDIMKQLDELAVLVEKTAGVGEREAFRTICDYVRQVGEASGSENR